MTYEAEAEAWLIERDRIADEWICKHPVAFKELATFATLTYHGQLGGFRRRMALLQQLAADAAGMPPFRAAA